VWWAIFYIDHVRYQASTGTNIRRQAEVIEQQFKKEANERRHSLVQVDPKMTFGELAARFIANAGAGPHHLDRLKHLLPYFADVPVVQINKGMVTEYRRYRHSRKSLKGATINRDISVIRHILYWAVDESLLLSNQLTRVRMERERRTRRPVMSVEEEIRLLEVSPVHLKRIVITALDTGMRRGEILNQLWEHVDLNRGLL
jgi:integrase